MADKTEFQKVQHQLVEQNIKIQASVNAGITKEFKVDVKDDKIVIS